MKSIPPKKLGKVKIQPSNGLFADTGFSLLELMIVLTITTLGVAIGVPSMSSWIERNKFRNETSEIFRTIALARTMASNRGIPISLCPLDTSNHCTDNWQGELTLFEDSDQSMSRDAGEAVIRLLKTRQSGDEATITRRFNRRVSILFRPIGNAFGHNGTFTICQQGRRELSATIIISSSGRIRLGKDDDNDGRVEDSNGNPVSCS